MGAMLNLVISVIVVIIGIYCLNPGPSFHSGLVKGKNVLITGASTGIGKEMALQYSRHGANVFITARSEKKLQKVISECRNEGHVGATFGMKTADMSNLNETKSVVEVAVSTLGGLDHLVLNHAYPNEVIPWSSSEENFKLLKLMFDVNFMSFVYLFAHAMPYVKATNGSVGIVNSVAGKIAFTHENIYSSTKFALDGFFQSQRRGWEADGVNVSFTNVVIGAIATEKFVELMEKLNTQEKEAFLAALPPADPAITAYEIMRGITMRFNEIYWPPTQHIKWRVLLRDWLPGWAGDFGI